MKINSFSSKLGRLGFSSIFHATTKQGLDNGIQILIDLVNIFEMRDFDINKLMNISVKYNIREELEIFL